MLLDGAIERGAVGRQPYQALTASDSKTEGPAPDNGLLLNALHDKAFDRGLLTIKKDLKAVMFGVVGHETPEDKYL